MPFTLTDGDQVAKKTKKKTNALYSLSHDLGLEVSGRPLEEDRHVCVSVQTPRFHIDIYDFAMRKWARHWQREELTQNKLSRVARTYPPERVSEVLNKTLAYHMGKGVGILISQRGFFFHHVTMHRANSQFSVDTDKIENQNAT